MSALPAPSESALRRALTRAERGVPLDAVEAETLLHARGLGEGEPLDRLLTAAARVRDAGLTSAGRPGRRTTYLDSIFWVRSGSAASSASVAGVTVVAMAMQLAVTPWRPMPRATARVKPAAPALAPA